MLTCIEYLLCSMNCFKHFILFQLGKISKKCTYCEHFPLVSKLRMHTKVKADKMTSKHLAS